MPVPNRKKLIRRARSWHRWLGAIFGVQFLFWTLGGLYFSWTRIPTVRSDDIRKEAPPLSLDNLPDASLNKAIKAFRGQYPQGKIHELRWVESRQGSSHLLMRFHSDGRERHARIDPVNAALLPAISPDEAAAIALGAVKPKVEVAGVTLLKTVTPGHEYREKPLPAFAVRLTGEADCTVYIGQETAEVHSIRNTQWRVFDFLWMLHIMDYRGRDDINNLILRIASLLGLLTLASGYLLLLLTRMRKRKTPTAAVILLILVFPGTKVTAQAERRLKPLTSFQPPAALNENSGMVLWNGRLWQHADGGAGPKVFETDSSDGHIVRTILVKNADNRDWEDMAQDDLHFYLGDFGNNADGARKDLAIYRILKSDLLLAPEMGDVPAEKISFRYPDMPDTIALPNRTDHDCEAMICHNGRLLLFTKQWVSKGSVLYALPPVPGDHVAVRLDSFDADGLVTGADFDPATGRIALSGYSQLLARFVWLLYDYSSGSPLQGSKARFQLAGPGQTESVAFAGSDRLYLGSERFRMLPARIEAYDIKGLLPEQPFQRKRKKLR